jgi:hypothetical protein
VAYHQRPLPARSGQLLRSRLASRPKWLQAVTYPNVFALIVVGVPLDEFRHDEGCNSGLPLAACSVDGNTRKKIKCRMGECIYGNGCATSSIRRNNDRSIFSYIASTDVVRDINFKADSGRGFLAGSAAVTLSTTTARIEVIPFCMQ